MQDLTIFVKKYLDLFEKFTLQKNKSEYLSKLPDSFERNLLQFLNQAIKDDQYQQILIKNYELPFQLAKLITEMKTRELIQKTDNIQQIQFHIINVLREMDLKDSFQPFKMQNNFLITENDEENKKNVSQQTPSVFKEYTLEDALEIVKENPQVIFFMLRKFKKLIPPQIIIDMPLQIKKSILNNKFLVCYFTTDTIIELIMNVYDQSQDVQYLLQQISPKLPNDIFYQIGSHHTYLGSNMIYLESWFQRKYSEELKIYEKDQQLGFQQKVQKRKVYHKVLTQISQKNTTKLRKQIQMIVKQIIRLDIQIQKYDIDVFINYLKIAVTNDQQVKIQESDTVKSYINGLLKQTNRIDQRSNILEKMSQYFQQQYLNKIYAERLLLDLGDVQEAQKYLGLETVRTIKDTVYLTLDKSNKKYYKTNEQVNLKMRIKNVSQIIIKIYEVDLLKYYSQTEFSNNQGFIQSKLFYSDQFVSLNYMKPFKSFAYSIQNKNPYKQKVYDIQIDQIARKNGAWIIQMEASTIVSRATIIKGNISVLEKPTIAGIQLSFHNQQGEHIKKLIAYINNRKQQIRENYLIPYGQKKHKVQIIAKNGNYAKKFIIKIPEQKYDLNIDYVYNSQCFIVGKNAKILLLPQLRLSGANDIPINIKLLKNIKIYANTQNKDNMSDQIEIKNVSFQNNKGFQLQIPFQVYAKNIQITVQATIQLLNGTKQKFNKLLLIQFDTDSNIKMMKNAYLRQVSHKNYCLFVLGRNGQPLSNQQVTLSYLQFEVVRRHINLISNKQGQIVLGDIGSYTNEIQLQIIHQSQENLTHRSRWDIKSLDNKIKLSSKQIYAKNQQINWPWPFLSKDVVLIKVYKNSKQIKTDKIQYNNNRLILENLSPGNYCLISEEIDTVQIEILDYMKTDNDHNNYIFYDKTCQIIKLPDYNHQTMQIRHTVQQKDNKNVINLQFVANRVIKQKRDLQIIVMASNFIIPQGNQVIGFSRLHRNKQILKYKIQKQECSYDSNYKFSEEIVYINNKNKAKKYVGNNLRKPQIFLNKIQVSQTQQIQQVLQPHFSCYASVKSSQECCVNEYPQICINYGLRSNENQMCHHHNFLQNNCYIQAFDFKPTISVKLPNKYNQFKVVVISDGNSIQKNFSYFNKTINKKDIRHHSLQNLSHQMQWTLSRQIYHLKKGQSLKINTNSEWKVIDLQQIVNLAKSKGIHINQWITQWNSYTQTKKKQVYNEKVCHQLNMFLKYNDDQFFDKVVKPFISNKIMKTFVDLCLIQSQKCLQWLSIDKFSQLNQFQKVMLVKELNRIERLQQAQSIAQTMISQSKYYQRNFDYSAQFDAIVSHKQNNLPALQQYSKHKRETLQQYIQEQNHAQQELIIRQQYKIAFQETQKTKQYTQVTYQGVRNHKDSTNMFQKSLFLAYSAQSFATNNSQLFNQYFMLLGTKLEYTIIPILFPHLNRTQYNLKNNQNNITIVANTPLTVLTKQLKQVKYQNKVGLILNQKIADPSKMYKYDDDGTRRENVVTKFYKQKVYFLETLITNITSNKLDIQMLIDIPDGSIPLQKYQYTYYDKISIKGYQTIKLKNYFYFPQIGCFKLYPANAQRNGKIIGRAQRLQNIRVQNFSIEDSQQLNENILKLGKQEQILSYLETKNIFDGNILRIQKIEQMMKNKQFYIKAMKIFRQRKYYNQILDKFSYLHRDLQSIKAINHKNTQIYPIKQEIFQYFPYYSNRTHKFQNQNKSIITNKQLQHSYLKLLFCIAISNPPKNYQLILIYYFILQDKIQSAVQIQSQVDQNTRNQCLLQYDYIACYLDMYKGYPSFYKSRQILKKYTQYPVISWKNMFQQLADLLNAIDSQQNTIMSVNQSIIPYQAKIINKQSQLILRIPANTSIQIEVYQIDIEFYFSIFPFEQIRNICPFIAPNAKYIFQKDSQNRQQIFKRPQSLKNSLVSIHSSSLQSNKYKLDEFHWVNPYLQVQIKQQEGILKVYYQSKSLPKCYCKIYQKTKSQIIKFYKDGYTDINGRFKYVQRDIEEIQQFSILVINQQYGGLIKKVMPPILNGYY